MPVIFLHGTRSTSQVWAKQIAELTRHGVPSLALDLPGHGARTAERFTMGGALRVVDDAVASFEQKPLLVGLSLGGYTALQYAEE